MRLLAINVGSSSVRLEVWSAAGATPERVLAERAEAPATRWAKRTARTEQTEPDDRLRAFLGRAGRATVAAVVHRVVHGGPGLSRPVRLDASVEREIERASPLAPLHDPAALAWVRSARRVLGAAVPQVAVFDTAFFADLPARAARYALPRELAARHGVRRYGFHGLAHEALWRRWRALRPDRARDGRVISFQLGAGCSAAAIRGGRPEDTSMGFSPLEGLVMATRAGDVDPGVLLHLQRQAGLDASALDALLHARAGLLGLSGTTGDVAALLATETPEARQAIEVYCHRARKYLGAYVAVLGGVDAILFGGGVGENVPEIRARILSGMAFLGIALDEAANAAARGAEADLAARPGCDVWTIPVDEGRILAERALELLAGAREDEAP